MRSAGPPAVVTRAFSAPGTGVPYLLRVRNGIAGQCPATSSAEVKLNGATVVPPSAFNPQVALIERSVALLVVSSLAVEVRSAPGTCIAVEVIGQDDTPPEVAATAEPSPNSAGWNNGSVTVTFTCSDAGAGVATCPSAVTVSTEGANQAVSGVAVDRAGNSATATAHLNIDRTAPSVASTASPVPNATGWNNSDVMVTFTCSDTLSGVATCPDAAHVTTEGEGQAVSGTAIDAAGNSANAELSVSLDKTPPQITAVAFPPPNSAGWHRDDIGVTFVCSDLRLTECPPAMTLTAEGADQPVAGTAVDIADNSATATLSVSLDKTPPTLTAVTAPAPNAAGWSRTDVAVTFEAEDALSGVASVTPPQTLSDEGAGQVVDGAAVDRAGNTATAQAVVNVDKTPPELALTAPPDGTVRRVPRVEVTGTATDANGIAALNVAGEALGVASPFTTEVALTEGPRTIGVEARDMADNTATASVNVVYSSPPVVEITAPADLTAVGTTPIQVSGTVDDPQATIVVGLERIPAVVSGNTFTATGVPLREGGNVLTAVATDALGNAGSDAVTVVLDTTAPRVVIVSPPDGSATTADTVSVSGLVNDIVIGTVNTLQAQVTVNGRQATVSHRSFVVEDVPLVPGSNTLTAVARDAVGNTDTFVATVIREAAAGPRLEVVSGSGQTAGINEQLEEPLVLAVANADGTPLPGRTVVFRVAENNGLLSNGPQTAAGLALTTDAAGRAQARYTLGSRAGVGNNRVEVTSPGIAGAAVFTASAVAHPPAKVNLDSGNNQKGVVNQPLPRPFVVVVTDDGHNRLAGVPVTFKVVAGDGSFNSVDTTTVTTDSDGRALTILTLGPRPGTENNVVEARVENLQGLPAAFSASGYEPGDPAETRISGVVLDNSNVPIPGVTLRVRNTAIAGSADAHGQFLLTGVPVGNVHLVVDGTTAQRAGTWPSLEYELVTVAGANNTLGMPIYLVALDTTNSIFVDETQGGTLTLPDYPGFSLTVAPNSATFPDGTRRGTITVTAVHPDKVPMVPNFGQQPRFIVTIQPPGVQFDPPAQVTHPNVDGLPPGSKTELYSFDHDMGSFVATGTATVSDDGAVIRSDPGAGVFKGGWHCGGNPATAGTVADCPDCKVCNGVRCVNLPDGSAPRQPIPGNCLREECWGGAVLPNRSHVEQGDAPPGLACCAEAQFTAQGVNVNVYNPQTDCCDAAQPMPRTGVIPLLSQCPNRVSRGVAHQFDGCSLPAFLAGVVNKDNPAGGASTHFSRPECIQFGINCTGACDVHDICYQTCHQSVIGPKTNCDVGLALVAHATCANSGDPAWIVSACHEFADIYFTVLLVAPQAWTAFDDRQRQYCKCCP